MNRDELLRSPALATLAALALEEDQVALDVTSQCLVPPDSQGSATLIAREDGVLAGLILLDGASPLMHAFPRLRSELHSEDGARIRKGSVLARLAGPARDLLAIERTLLNFLQRLSGIATETARFVACTAGTRARIQETRKTCPGFRALDKYAVRTGGGLNHRLDLSDQILIKENHLIHADLPAAASAADRIALAVRRARARGPEGCVIEVEVETPAEFRSALEAGPDIIMLDDFNNADTIAAIALRDAAGGIPIIEVSGGIRFERVAELAAMGVDRISVGALTHSVRALDLALKIATEAAG